MSFSRVLSDHEQSPWILPGSCFIDIKLYMERIIEYHEEESLSFIRDCFLTGNGILQPCLGFVPSGGGAGHFPDFCYREYIPFLMFCSGNPLGDPGGQDRLPAYHGPVLFLLLISKIIFWKAWSFQDFLLERIFLSIAVSGLSGVDITLLYLYAPEGKSQKVFGIYEGLGTGGLLTASVCFSLFLKNSWRRAALLTAAAYGLAFVLALFLGRQSQKDQKFLLQKLRKKL